MNAYDDLHPYQICEHLLLRLLDLLSDVFTDSDKKDVQDFIDVDEYELAFDSLEFHVFENNYQIPGESLIFIFELVDLMEFDIKKFLGKIKKF